MHLTYAGGRGVMGWEILWPTETCLTFWHIFISGWSLTWDFFPPMKLNVSSTKSRFLTGLKLTVRSLEIAEEITPLDSIQTTQSSLAIGW